MKWRIPLYVKLVVPFLLILTLSVGFSGYRIYQLTQARWQTEMDTRLERVATLLVQTLDTDALLSLKKPTDMGVPAYVRLQQQLEQASTAANLGWIGVYYREDGQLYYWVDEGFTGVGYPFFYATPQHFAAFEDRQPHWVHYTDEFGTYYGIVVPVMRDGQVIAIVEASIEEEARYLMALSAFRQVWPILVGGILLGIIASLFITALSLSRPLQELRHGAQALARGEFGHTITFRSHDELGELAETFNLMSAELARLYEELQRYNRELEERVALRTAELSAERNRLSTILRNIADGLLVTERQHQVILVNPALGEILMRDTDGLSDRPLREILPHPDLLAAVDEALRTPSGIVSTTITWPPPGMTRQPPRIYKATACALNVPEAQAVIGVVTILRDITHEVEVDRMKTDFISMVSHELRTPLTSVLGFTKLIQKTLLKQVLPALDAGDNALQRGVQRIMENLHIIIAEGERLTRLINDVLDIAKIEAGKVEWHISRVSVAEIVQSAALATSALALDKRLPVVLDIAPDVPTIEGDYDRLVQVITNLFSNAIKFSDAGQITARVRALRVADDHTLRPALKARIPLVNLQPGPWVLIEVEDTGPGIAEENLEKVFEKFKQVGEVMTNRPRGTGLGLTISKEIIEHHGGLIWAESALGQGSTFRILLPALPLQVQPETAPAFEVQARRERPTGPQEAPLILVVDDEQSIRTLVRQVLTEAGYRIAEAVDGVDGLTKARTLQPDLIVLDLMMPQLSGFDVLSALRSDPATSGLPVIILSVLDDRRKGLRLGADAYLTKPLNVDDLLVAIRSLLARAARGEGRRRVLLVEEDATLIETLATVFTEQGYEVLLARDGEEGLRKALDTPPNYVIVDAELSRQNDFALLRAIKQNQHTREAYVIVMSMRLSPDDVDDWLTHGADWLDTPEQLMDWLKKHMELKRTREKE